MKTLRMIDVFLRERGELVQVETRHLMLCMGEKRRAERLPAPLNSAGIWIATQL